MQFSKTETDRAQAIESRESQLWWLAVIVILLLSLALFALDTSGMTGNWWFSPQLEFALNMKTVRVTLIVSALLICAYFRDTARRLRRQNHRLLSDLAEHGRLLEKKNYEICRLKDLSDQLIGITDLHTALDLILGLAVDLAGADVASIMIREKGSDTLRIAVARGLSERVVESTRVKMGEGIAGRVAVDGRPVILNSDDLTGEMARRATRGKAIVSSVVVPIQVGDDIRGVVSAAKRRGEASTPTELATCFTEEDLGVVSTLANQASLVIQKTDLLSDLQERIHTLAATVEELRQARAELVQSEKLASIGQLAGGVAHEINNPLQVILGRAELLLLDEGDPTKTEDLQCILDHTKRIAGIVRNLLSFSRQTSDDDQSDLDINEVVEKTLNLLEPQIALDDVKVVRQLSPGLPTIFGSAGRLQQVFTNIVLNAYQAMRETCGKIVVSSCATADGVEIAFADTGPGICRENLDRLFDPFFTTKPEGEGTGLGLSISYGIVQSHGGRIEVSSEVGLGTCFAIVLPVGRCGVGSSDSPAESQAEHGQEERISEAA